MTDLNLDGLPALQSIVEAGKAAPSSRERKAIGELRQLVERERIEQARGDLAEINRAAERLPAWAKPVMRHLRRLMEYRKPPDEHEHSAVSFCRVYQALERAWRALTEAQLKEIGEDDSAGHRGEARKE